MNLWVERVFGDVASSYAGETTKPQPDTADIVAVQACIDPEEECGACLGGVAAGCDVWDTSNNQCGPDGYVDVWDWVAVVDAVAGIPACPDPNPCAGCE